METYKTAMAVHRKALALLAILMGSSLLLYGNAFRTFDFFDMSMFLDAGYRVFRGQAIYTDFAYQSGPLHPYLHALSFWLLGFNKQAVLVHLWVMNGAAVVLVYWLFLSRLGSLPTLCLSALAGVSFYSAVGHPWYDQNAFVMSLVGLCLFEKVRDRRWASILAGLFAAFAFMVKSNVGSATVGMFGLAIIVDRDRLRNVVSLLTGFLAGFLIVLLTLKSPSDFIYQNFVAFDASSRLTQWFQLVRICRITAYGPLMGLLLFAAALMGWPFVVQERRTFALALGVWLAAVFDIWTSSMQWPANIHLYALFFGFLCLLTKRFWQVGDDTGERRIGKSLVVLLVAAYLLLFADSIKQAKNLSQWSWRGAMYEEKYALSVPGFEGWRCLRPECDGVNHVVDYIRQTVPLGDSLFVFPDATVIYGFTGRESLRDVPFAFSLRRPGYPSVVNGRVLERWLTELHVNPPDWLVLHSSEKALFNASMLKDYGLEEWVSENYDRQWTDGEFEVLKRRH